MGDGIPSTRELLGTLAALIDKRVLQGLEND
jgi:hypothetical protein